MMMELNRISSHLVWLGTGGMEIGALTACSIGFRERELILDIFEMVTGLRMNHAYIRPGGVTQDLPPGAVEKIRELVQLMPGKSRRVRATCSPASRSGSPGCRASAISTSTPASRSASPARCCALRACRGTCARASPTAATRPTSSTSRPTTKATAYARFLVRLDEMRESVKIVEQCLDRLRPGPVMVEDKKIAWPAQLALGADGMGNSLDHIRHIMGDVDGGRSSTTSSWSPRGSAFPPGQVYVPIESPRGELGVPSSSATAAPSPYRVHLREPSFVNLQAVAGGVRGQPDRRRHRVGRRHRPGDGRVRPLSAQPR